MVSLANASCGARRGGSLLLVSSEQEALILGVSSSVSAPLHGQTLELVSALKPV